MCGEVALAGGAWHSRSPPQHRSQTLGVSCVLQERARQSTSDQERDLFLSAKSLHHTLLIKLSIMPAG